MQTLSQVKFERLKAQTEREVITNEILKGTLVRWDDVKVIFSARIAEARNQILMIPSLFADKLSREEVEQCRKIVNQALQRAADIGSIDVNLKRTSSMKEIRKLKREL